MNRPSRRAVVRAMVRNEPLSGEPDQMPAAALGADTGNPLQVTAAALALMVRRDT